MGVWIDDFSWEKSPGKPGRLRYSLAHDLSHSKKPDVHFAAHRVTIVGVKLVPHAADLVPVPDPKLGYCRKEGSKLRVTVKNQGGATAPPSTTRVDFGATSETLPTPQLAAGDSTDLLFDIPPGCFHPNCYFRITVNAGHEVAEDGGEGNNVAEGLCTG